MRLFSEFRINLSQYCFRNIMEAKFLKNFLKLLYFPLFTYPYKISWSQTSTFKVHFSLKKNHQYYIWLFCTFFRNTFHLILLCIQLPVTFSSYQNEKDYLSLVFHTLWMGGLGASLVNQFFHFVLGSKIAFVVNQTEKLMRNMESVHFKPGAFDTSRKFRARILTVLAITFTLSMILTVPVFVKFQHENFPLGSHLTRLLISVGASANVAVVFGVAVDTWEIAGVYGAVYLSFFIGCLFLHTFKTGVTLILDEASMRRRGENNLEKLHKDYVIYTKLRVLTKHFNRIFQHAYIPPFQLISAILFVQGIFIVTELSSGNPMVLTFGLSLTMCCILLVGTFVNFMAMVHDNSKKLLMDFQAREIAPRRRKFATRIIKAFKVEAVKSGNFYDIKKVTCLTYFGLLSNMAGSILISYKL